MIWTAEAEAKLRRLWDTGKAASQIGEIMGCTRNTILGKAHRMKLSDRIIKHTLGKRFKNPRERAKTRGRNPSRSGSGRKCVEHPSPSCSTPKYSLPNRPPNARPAPPTKKEMREMLTIAVLNTGGHL
jgi:GcrA cell cycle regulator